MLDTRRSRITWPRVGVVIQYSNFSIANLNLDLNLAKQELNILSRGEGDFMKKKQQQILPQTITTVDSSFN